MTGNRQYKILLVDDDDDILRTLELAFLTTPFQLTTVNHPERAYEMIENEHFDMVISDIQMPDMDGLTLLRKIKNFNGMIQVIMITGHITINNTLNAFRYGAADIFFKPFEDINEITRAAGSIALKLDRSTASSTGLPKEGNRSCKMRSTLTPCTAFSTSPTIPCKASKPTSSILKRMPPTWTSSTGSFGPSTA